MNPFGADRWEEIAKSSNIKAIGTRGDWLIVKFRSNGAVYRYRGFSSLYIDLISAPSIGKMFHQAVLTSTKGERLLLEEWPDEG